MHLEVEFPYLLPFNLESTITASCEIIEGDLFQGPEMRDFLVKIDPEPTGAFTKLALAMSMDKTSIDEIAENKLWEAYARKTSRDPMELDPNEYLNVSDL